MRGAAAVSHKFCSYCLFHVHVVLVLVAVAIPKL